MALEALVSSLNVRTILVFTALYLLLRYLLNKITYESNRPPCPWFRVPLFGNFPLVAMNSDLLDTLKQLRKKHGDIFRLEMGSVSLVVISGYDAMYKAFVKRSHTFSGRPDTFFTKICKGQGIISSEGKTWSEQRRFCIQGLKVFGFGRTRVEVKVHKEVQKLLSHLALTNGSNFNPKFHIQKSIANVIGGLLYGGSLDVDSRRFQHFMELNDENIRLTGVSSVLNFFPILEYLPFDLFKFHKLTQNFATMREFIKEIISEHRRTLRNDDEPRDFVDLYIREIEKRRTVDQNTSFHEDQAVILTTDMLVAGVETTSTALCWALVYLMRYPEIQSRIQSEIDQAVPLENLPSMSNRTAMPYTEAFIMELLRHSYISPLGLQHSVTDDVVFEGFYIKRTDVIIPNMNSVFTDSAIWESPEVFNPGRFLDDEGRLVYPDAYIPFFLGKRVCPGEHLARMNLLLFLAGILQHYTIVSPPGQDPHAISGIMGITFAPKEFEVSCERRFPQNKVRDTEN